MSSKDKVEALRAKIGMEGKIGIIECGNFLIRRFVEAVGDPNPLWHDEPALDGTYRRTMLPPFLFCSSMFSGAATYPELPLPYERILDGEAEWEFLQPAWSGDTITSVTKFIGFEQREGKSGHMIMLNFEATHHNQRGELVAKTQATLINLQ